MALFQPAHVFLADTEINELIAAGRVFKTFGTDISQQVQPASLDLSLGRTCYSLRATIRPTPAHPESSVKPSLLTQYRPFILEEHAIDATSGITLYPGRSYLFTLGELLNLPEDFSARANPKSTTGRLDIFVRVVTESGDPFDTVPPGYVGMLYLEVSPRTFPVRVYTGTKLAQLRFTRKAKRFQRTQMRYEPCQLDLVGDIHEDDQGIVGYRAKRHAPIVDLSQLDHYAPAEFWDAIFYDDVREGLILDPGEFYILSSLQTVRVQPNEVAEMLPFDAELGEFRVHYAGFFDPGFNAHAVLEVRGRDIPYVLRHGQTVARLRYDSVRAPISRLYGADIGSNYHQQKLRLAKQFVARTSGHN